MKIVDRLSWGTEAAPEGWEVLDTSSPPHGGKNSEPEQVSWVIIQVAFCFHFSAVEWDASRDVISFVLLLLICSYFIIFIVCPAIFIVLSSSRVTSIVSWLYALWLPTCATKLHCMLCCKRCVTYTLSLFLLSVNCPTKCSNGWVAFFKLL
jgi:hypothetical protein